MGSCAPQTSTPPLCLSPSGIAGLGPKLGLLCSGHALCLSAASATSDPQGRHYPQCSALGFLTSAGSVADWIPDLFFMSCQRVSQESRTESGSPCLRHECLCVESSFPPPPPVSHSPYKQPSLISLTLLRRQPFLSALPALDAFMPWGPGAPATRSCGLPAVTLVHGSASSFSQGPLGSHFLFFPLPRGRLFQSLQHQFRIC